MTLTKVKDCVCGTEISTSRSAGSGEYKGDIYFFCSPECRQKFDEHPAKYAAAAKAEKPKGRRGRKPAPLTLPENTDEQDDSGTPDSDDEPKELMI